MLSKKLKYQEFLSRFPNCPPDNYTEIEKDAFRWIHQNEHENDFKPLNLIKNPPARIIDDSDNMCKAYGLSLFDSLKNAYGTYKKYYTKRREHLRPDFINEFGECIATLKVVFSEGVAGDLNPKSGHFTFHEYENVDLRTNIHPNLFSIFDNNGKFIN